MFYYEDLVVGTVEKFGAYEVTREEVVEFAAKYDPQAFHLSDEAAAQTHFGRLSASGWHTCAMTMAMVVENMKRAQHAGLGSPGVDELRWLRPVYPGDTLNCESELLSKRRSKNRPEMGLLRSAHTVRNQDGVAVLTFISNGMIATRDPMGSE